LVGLIFGGHLNAFKNVKQWQIKQNKLGFCTVQIEKMPDYTSEDENEISRLLLSVYIHSVFIYSDSFSLSTSGKRKFVIQELSDIS
jgi:phenylacetate-CoA ligase